MSGLTNLWCNRNDGPHKRDGLVHRPAVNEPRFATLSSVGLLASSPREFCSIQVGCSWTGLCCRPPRPQTTPGNLLRSFDNGPHRPSWSQSVACQRKSFVSCSLTLHPRTDHCWPPFAELRNPAGDICRQRGHECSIVGARTQLAAPDSHAGVVATGQELSGREVSGLKA